MTTHPHLPFTIATLFLTCYLVWLLYLEQLINISSMRQALLFPSESIASRMKFVRRQERKCLLVPTRSSGHPGTNEEQTEDECRSIRTLDEAILQMARRLQDVRQRCRNYSLHLLCMSQQNMIGRVRRPSALNGKSVSRMSTLRHLCRWVKIPFFGRRSSAAAATSERPLAAPGQLFSIPPYLPNGSLSWQLGDGLSVVFLFFSSSLCAFQGGG